MSNSGRNHPSATQRGVAATKIYSPRSARRRFGHGGSWSRLWRPCRDWCIRQRTRAFVSFKNRCAARRNTEIVAQRRWPGRARHTVYVLCALALPLHPAVAHPARYWTVTIARLTAAGRFIRWHNLTVVGSSPQGRLTLRDRAGQSRSIAWADVLQMTTSPAAPPTAAPWQLILRNGDILCGQPMNAGPGQAVFSVQDLGLIHVPIQWIAGLRRKSSTAIPIRPAAEDILYFRNGDRLKGAFLTLGSQAVRWSSTLGKIQIPLTRVDHFVLGGPVGTISSKGVVIRLQLAGGGVWSASHPQWTKGQIHCRDWLGHPLVFPSAAVDQVTVRGGRVQWLAALTPTAYQQVSYFGGHWPLVVNRNVRHGPLRVDQQVFTHGLGLHVGAAVTYQLPGGFRWLFFAPAMDDTARPYGQAKVLVLANGKALYQSPVLTPGAPIHRVRLSLRGVRTLELKALDASHYGVRGYVDWLDAALWR